MTWSWLEVNACGVQIDESDIASDQYQCHWDADDSPEHHWQGVGSRFGHSTCLSKFQQSEYQNPLSPWHYVLLICQTLIFLFIYCSLCRQYSWQSVQYQMSSQVWQKFVRRCRVSASSPGRRSFPELAKSAKRRSPSCPAVTSPRTRWPISASGGMRVEFTWRKVTARMTQSSRMFSSTPTPHLSVRPDHLHSPLGVRHPRGSRQDPYPRGSCQDLLREDGWEWGYSSS